MTKNDHYKILHFGSKFAKANWVRNLADMYYPKCGAKKWSIPLPGEIIRESKKTITVDSVRIVGGLYPSARLAAGIGCLFRFVAELGGHFPVVLPSPTYNYGPLNDRCCFPLYSSHCYALCSECDIKKPYLKR